MYSSVSLMSDYFMFKGEWRIKWKKGNFKKHERFRIHIFHGQLRVTHLKVKMKPEFG